MSLVPATPSGLPVLDVRGLEKSFTLHNRGGQFIRGLSGVDLTVGEGEHVALAGTSGAGKSSLLKCVYRTYLSSAGQILFRNDVGHQVDLATLDERAMANLRDREIGYVSQFLRAEPRRTTFDVVRRAGNRRGMVGSEAADAAAQALREVRIPESLWSSFPSVLSGGERQRVNIAKGTIAAPRLLLLDEPVSALDPENREAVLERIAGLRANNVALLSVFHDLDAMRRLATRVVMLREGLVTDNGAPDDVLAVH